MPDRGLRSCRTTFCLQLVPAVAMPIPTRPTTTPGRRVRNSGRRLVVTLAASLAVATTLVLLVLRLPALVEWWFVTATWWLIWFCTVASLLYRGGSVRDDVRWDGPKFWFKRNPQAPAPSSRSKAGANAKGFDWIAWIPDLGCGPVTEFLGMLAIVLIAGLAAYWLAWLVVELLIPIVALVIYVQLHGMLSLAAVASGRCRRDVWRAVVFALIWATVYSTPLAVVLWLTSLAKNS